MAGTLYVVATPIGNMEDMPPRARRVLGEADVIAAEDTRVAQKLLRLLGLRNETVSNHKFNERKQAETLLADLLAGKRVALISDAGTPCIADPGGVLVDEAARRGIPVVGIGGPSAVMLALSVSGFIFTGFSFHGFLPRTINEIKKTLAASEGVCVFFESPKRIEKSLAVFASAVPEARLCLCNDLTKLYERVYRGTPADVLAQVQANPSAGKGEYTLVAELPPLPEAETPAGISMEALLLDYMIQHGVTAKEAVAALADGKRKKDWYAAALRLKDMRP